MKRLQRDANKRLATKMAEFWQEGPKAHSVMCLFDALPQTYFFAKDREGRFVKVNHLFLENHGLASEAEAIGKTDRDFHPPVMAEAYIADDRRVMQSGVVQAGQVWPVLHRRQTLRWYVATKIPIFDDSGKVIGVAGVMYQIDQPGELADRFQELLPVVQYIDRAYATGISMADMAKLAGLSTTHFNRRFQQILRMNPTTYLTTVRVQHARQLLATSSMSLAEIADRLGYTDQSHFTRRFRHATGMTPNAYRKRFMK